jgi:DHA1 family bicyclomycin/chloramphenicol resistance-like MFS transporter
VSTSSKAFARNGAAPLRLLALLIAMTALGPLSLNILVPALPGLVKTLATDLGTVQLTVSLYLVGLACSQLLMGPLSDRFGRRPVALVGLCLTALSSIAGIAAASIESLIVARIVQAIGASTGIVVARAIIRDLYERDRAAGMIGWVATAMVVAPMIAPLIGGLLDTAFGWEMIFVFVAVAACAVLAWACIALPETRPDHVTGGGIRYLWGETRALLASRSFIAYVLCGTFASGTFFCFLSGAPYVAITLMGRSSAEYGAWFALMSFGYMAGNSTAGQLSARYGVNAMIATGVIFQIVGALASVPLTPFLLATGPAPLFIAQTLIAFGNGVLLPNSIAGAVSVRPQSTGTASGLTGFTQLAVGAVATQATSLSVDAASSAWPMQIGILLFALALVAVFLTMVPRQKRDS